MIPSLFTVLTSLFHKKKTRSAESSRGDLRLSVTRSALQKLRCGSFDDLEPEIGGFALEIVNLQFAVLGCSPVA